MRSQDKTTDTGNYHKKKHQMGKYHISNGRKKYTMGLIRWAHCPGPGAAQAHSLNACPDRHTWKAALPGPSQMAESPDQKVPPLGRYIFGCTCLDGSFGRQEGQRSNAGVRLSMQPGGRPVDGCTWVHTRLEAGHPGGWKPCILEGTASTAVCRSL